MAYTALQQMKNRNEKAFGKGAGPIQPERHYDSVDHGLKAMALRFLHARCEGLGFAAEESDGAFHGTSLLPGQILYNMQMDLKMTIADLPIFILLSQPLHILGIFPSSVGMKKQVEYKQIY